MHRSKAPLYSITSSGPLSALPLGITDKCACDEEEIFHTHRVHVSWRLDQGMPADRELIWSASILIHALEDPARVHCPRRAAADHRRAAKEPEHDLRLVTPALCA